MIDALPVRARVAATLLVSSLLLCAGALGACVSFASVDAPADGDGGALDGARADANGGTDAAPAAIIEPPPACPSLFVDGFDGPSLDARWTVGPLLNGNVGVGTPTTAATPTHTTALVASFDVSDGGSARAYARTELVANLDDAAGARRDAGAEPALVVRARVLVPPPGAFVELGCKVQLLHASGQTFLTFARFHDGSLIFRSRVTTANPVDSTLLVASEAESLRWTEATLAVVFRSQGAHVTFTLDAAGARPATRDLTLPAVIGARFDCGVPFANRGAATYESAIDELSVAACPP